MTYISVSSVRRLRVLLAGCVVSLAFSACGESSSGDDIGGDAGVLPPLTGCLLRVFSDEPDIIGFPSIKERTLSPGSTVEFSVLVDSETRMVKATLMDAWRLRSTPQDPSETVMMPTAGDEPVDFAIPIQTTGRYYVDLELCASNCDRLRVVYTLNRANAGEESTAIGDPYERILFEGDEEVRSTFTCAPPDSVAIQ
jgi:hypothetical protein